MIRTAALTAIIGFCVIRTGFYQPLCALSSFRKVAFHSRHETGETKKRRSEIIRQWNRRDQCA
jgi:hypothetical protein